MKTINIAYWIITGLAAALFTMSGISDLVKAAPVFDMITKVLGYPVYFLTILGVAKILGVVALIVPGFPRLKEWAYAGFTINMLGAALSHLAVGDTANVGGSIFGLTLTLLSYYFYRRRQSSLQVQVS